MSTQKTNLKKEGSENPPCKTQEKFPSEDVIIETNKQKGGSEDPPTTKENPQTRKSIFGRLVDRGSEPLRDSLKDVAQEFKDDIKKEINDLKKEIDTKIKEIEDGPTMSSIRKSSEEFQSTLRDSREKFGAAEAKFHSVVSSVKEALQGMSPQFSSTRLGISIVHVIAQILGAAFICYKVKNKQVRAVAVTMAASSITTAAALAVSDVIEGYLVTAFHALLEIFKVKPNKEGDFSMNPVELELDNLGYDSGVEVTSGEDVDPTHFLKNGTKSLVLVFASLIGVKVDPESIDFGDIKKSAGFTRDLKGMAGFLSSVMGMARTAVDGVTEAVTGVPMINRDNRVVVEEALVWMVQVQNNVLSLGDEQLAMTEVPEKIQEIIVLHEQGLEIGKKIDKLKGHLKFHQFYKMQDQLRNIYTTAKRKKMTSGVRHKPVTIMLTGPPGTGKSALADFITAFCQYQDGVPFTEYSVYKKNRDTEYWEGYFSQYCCMIEELVGQSGANGKANDQKFTDTMTIIDAATDLPYPLNMAFGGKGSTYFHSNLLVASSNLLRPGTKTPMWPVLPIADANAFKSRFDFLAVVDWKKGYANPNGRGTNTASYDLNAWEIDLYDPVTLAPISTVSAIAFFEMIYTKLCAYRDPSKKTSSTRHVLEAQKMSGLSKMFGARQPIVVQSGEDEVKAKKKKRSKEEKEAEAQSAMEAELMAEKERKDDITGAFMSFWEEMKNDVDSYIAQLEELESPHLSTKDIVTTLKFDELSTEKTMQYALAKKVKDHYMINKGAMEIDNIGTPLFYYDCAKAELDFQETIAARVKANSKKAQKKVSLGDFSDFDMEDVDVMNTAVNVMEKHLSDRGLLSTFLLTRPGEGMFAGTIINVLADFPLEQRDVYGALLVGLHLRETNRIKEGVSFNMNFCMRKWKELCIQPGGVEKHMRNWRKMKKEAKEWKKVKLEKLTDIVGEEHLPLKVLAGVALVGSVVAVGLGAAKLFTMFKKGDEEDEDMPETQSVGIKRAPTNKKGAQFQPRKMNLKKPGTSVTGLDAGAIDVSEHVIRPNTYHMILLSPEQDSKVRRLHGVLTFFKGRMAITPAHVWIEPLDKPENWKLQLVAPGLDKKPIEVDVKELDFLQDGDNDLLFVRFPQRIQEHKDILSHWMLDSDIPKMKGLHHNIGICCPREKSFSLMHTDKMEFQENCIANDDKNEMVWVTPNSFRAQMPTVSGDSGSIVLYYGTHFVRKVFGMNLAGNTDEQSCYFAIVTREMLDAVEAAFIARVQGGEDDMFIAEVREEFKEMMDVEKTELKEEMCNKRYDHVKCVGVVRKEFKPREMATNEQVEGPASGLFSDVLEIPCTLKPVVGPDGNTPLEREVVKSDYKPKLMAYEVKKVYDEVTANMYAKYHYKHNLNVPLTNNQVLNGVAGARFLRSMAANKSHGFPYTSTKEKFYQRTANGELHLTTFGEGEITRIREMAKERDRLPLVYRVFLKDERKSPWFRIADGTMVEATLEQIEERTIEDPRKWQTKTRSICGAPEPLKFLTKQYFGSFVNQAVAQDLEMPTGTQIGMNPHSLDTHHLHTKLIRIGNVKALFGDYKGFEHELDEAKTEPHFEGMRAWYRNGPEKCSPLDDKIRETIGRSTAKPVVIVDGVMYLYEREPSGHWLTAFLNSKVNESMLRTAICFIMWENKRESYDDAVDFDKYFCIITLGDDNGLVYDASLDFFSLHVLCDRLKQLFGAKMTDYRKVLADYPERWPKYHDLYKVEFLKRSFVKDDFGYWHMALRKDVIYDMCNWVSRKLNPEQATRDNMVQMFLEAFHWGHEFFSEVKAKCNTWLSHRGLQIIPYTYGSLMSKYLSGSLEELLPEERPAIVQSSEDIVWREGLDAHGNEVDIEEEEFPMRQSHNPVSENTANEVRQFYEQNAELIYTDESDWINFWCHECRGYESEHEHCMDRHYHMIFNAYDCYDYEEWQAAAPWIWENREKLIRVYFGFYEKIGYEGDLRTVLGMMRNISILTDFHWDLFAYYRSEGMTILDRNWLEHVEVQSSEDFQEGETMAVINEKTEMAEFSDQTSIAVGKIKLPRSSYTEVFNPLPHENWEQVLSRVVNKTYSWTPAMDVGSLLFELDFPRAILEQNEYMWEIIRQYQRFSASIHLEFRINSTQFHSGALAVASLPHCKGSLFTRNNEFFTVPAPTWANAISASTMEHRIISANTPTVISVDIPFVAPSHFWNPFHWTPEQMDGFFGRVEVWVLSQLMNSQDTASPVTVSVFMSFRSIKLTGPTIRGTKVTSGEDVEMDNMEGGVIDKGYSEMEREQESSTSSRKISQVANFVANILGAFRIFPIVSGVATAGSLFSRGVAMFARATGRNDPTSLAMIEPRLLQSTDCMVHGMGNDASLKYAIDPQNIVATDPRGYGEGTDWMLFANYKSMPGIISTFTAQASNEPGEILAKIHVSPTVCEHFFMDLGGTEKHLVELSTNTSYLASHFKYWTGSMNYMVMIFATKFVSGRLRVTWAPSTHHQPASGLDQGAANMINQVYDFNGDTQFVFNVPYLALNDWCRCVPSTQLRTMLSTDPRFHDATAGTLLFSLANELAYSMEPTTAKIDVVVYASGGPDLKFAVPSNLYRDYKFHVRKMPVVQSSEDWFDPRGLFTTTFPAIHDGSVHVVREKVEMGEEIRDFKTLFHRYSTEATNEDSDSFKLDSSMRKTFFYANRRSQYAAFKRAFLFHRGSERFRLYTIGTTSGQQVVSGVDLLPNSDTTNLNGNSLTAGNDGFAEIGLDGIIFQDFRVRPFLEVEVPYYSINMMRPGDGGDAFPGEMEHFMVPRFLTKNTFGSEAPASVVYSAAGDDFTVGVPTCPPRLVLKQVVARRTTNGGNQPLHVSARRRLRDGNSNDNL